jgi:hypothetical protein
LYVDDFVYLSPSANEESYAIVSELGLTHDNICPTMTPFCLDLPIDTIPHIDLSDQDRAPIINKMHSWLGMLNWLCKGTQPDFASIISLLASFTSSPSPGHLYAIKHVGRYLKSTTDFGLFFSSIGNPTLEAFIHFPFHDDTITSDGILGFCDANRGSQDASIPKSGASLCSFSIMKPSLFVAMYFLRGVLLLNGYS